MNYFEITVVLLAIWSAVATALLVYHNERIKKIEELVIKETRKVM